MGTVSIYKRFFSQQFYSPDFYLEVLLKGPRNEYSLQGMAYQIMNQPAHSSSNIMYTYFNKESRFEYVNLNSGSSFTRVSDYTPE